MNSGLNEPGERTDLMLFWCSPFSGAWWNFFIPLEVRRWMYGNQKKEGEWLIRHSPSFFET
jgi:hypothetical protein